MKLCEPFCKTIIFWHCSALEYHPTLIISIGVVFWHPRGDERFTRICYRALLRPSEIWLLLLDGSCYASWRHSEYWELMRFASGTQHGSWTPVAAAESKLFILSGWEKHLWSLNLNTNPFISFGDGERVLLCFWWVGWFFFLKSKHFPRCAHSEYHCVQEPFQDFISPDINSGENSGAAASLLLTTKRASCIEGFDLFILQSKNITIYSGEA